MAGYIVDVCALRERQHDGFLCIERGQGLAALLPAGGKAASNSDAW